MKNLLHIHTSTHQNDYFYDMNDARLVYVHPLIKNMILQEREGAVLDEENMEEMGKRFPEYEIDDILYYLKKYRYWRSSGLYNDVGEYSQNYSTKINPLHIKQQLANISQIVFEVTDNCNLKCYYCGYGQLYNFYDERKRINLDKEKAFHLIDYFADLWKSSFNISVGKEVCISFYGGEPLMNVPLIQEIITYLESKEIPDLKFYYAMTTNGVLLRKYADFLVEHDFHLLISLDGNRQNNSYRILKNNASSFDLVYDNISYLRDRHPEYFRKRVNFNSVLHNRNSVADIYKFIKKEFDKLPAVGELNTMGVREDAKKEFTKAYRNTIESLHQHEDYAAIEEDMFVLLPDSKSMVYFIHRYTGNVFNQYNDFFLEKKSKAFFPTATCFPFSRKLFMTTGGKILQCERIAHKYSLGSVDEEGVHIDYQSMADKLGFWYSKLEKQCKHCFRLGACSQCVFYVDKLEEKPVCPGFATVEALEAQFGSTLYHLEENRTEYGRIIKEIAII